MVPKRNCVKKEFLKLKGTSLSKWVQEPHNLYIDGNLSKYLKKKGVTDSIWYKSIKELQEFANDEEICLFTAYERCIRQTPQLWNSLDNLEDKILGCWCKPSQPCCADVLIKLFNEKKNDEMQKELTTIKNKPGNYVSLFKFNTDDIKQEFGIQTDKYEEYETSVDLTDDDKSKQ